MWGNCMKHLETHLPFMIWAHSGSRITLLYELEGLPLFNCPFNYYFYMPDILSVI